jgi:uncharacterized protein with PIN domain
MLGTLAKWLRILGYDTLYDPALDDHQLVRLARADGRVLLTRDTELARRPGLQSLLVASQDLQSQIRQVLIGLDLKPDWTETRCTLCNERLRPIDRASARARVPAYVAETQHAFTTCPACQRVYWRGTHWQHMQEWLSQLGLLDVDRGASQDST